LGYRYSWRLSLHILFLSDNFPPEVNACASRVFERACYWSQWGYQVTIITSAPNFPEGKLFPGYKNKWYQKEYIQGIHVIRVKTFIAANRGVFFRILDFFSYMLMAFLAGLKQKKTDVVIATSPQFFAAVGGWILAKVKRAPFIFELSDLWPESITAVGAMRPSFALRQIERLELKMYHQAKAIIALTAAFKTNLINRGINREKIHVITNGVDLTRFDRQPKNQFLIEKHQLSNRFIIGYIGTIGMAHDLQQMVTVAEKCHNKNLLFMFIGAGSETNQLIERIKDIENILILSRQPKSEISKYWSVCDIALVHLKNDPAFAHVIPSKIFEIMGMGLPICCIAPDGQATQLIKKTQAGICLPCEQHDLIAEKLCQLSKDPKQLETWANNSYQARLNYTRELQAKKMLAVIQEVCQNDC